MAQVKYTSPSLQRNVQRSVSGKVASVTSFIYKNNLLKILSLECKMSKTGIQNMVSCKEIFEERRAAKLLLHPSFLWPSTDNIEHCGIMGCAAWNLYLPVPVTFISSIAMYDLSPCLEYSAGKRRGNPLAHFTRVQSKPNRCNRDVIVKMILTQSN